MVVVEGRVVGVNEVDGVIEEGRDVDVMVVGVVVTVRVVGESV